MKNIETITKILNITIEQAIQVKGVIEGNIDPLSFESVTRWVGRCYNMPSKFELKLEALNEIIEGYGIEYIQHKDDTFTDPQGLTYVNLGDTYANTIIFDHSCNSFKLCSFGDIVESDTESYI